MLLLLRLLVLLLPAAHSSSSSFPSSSPLLAPVPRPSELVFFSEFSVERGTLLPNATSLSHLRRLNATVAVAIRDFSDARAADVRTLNANGIPAIAWLVLAAEDGYWFNAANAVTAAPARFAAFRNWTRTHGLKWKRIGLDLEFDLREEKALMSGDLQTVAQYLKEDWNATQVRAANESLAEIVRVAEEEEGWATEVYTVYVPGGPFVVVEGGSLWRSSFYLVLAGPQASTSPPPPACPPLTLTFHLSPSLPPPTLKGTLCWTNGTRGRRRYAGLQGSWMYRPRRSRCRCFTAPCGGGSVKGLALPLR